MLLLMIILCVAKSLPEDFDIESGPINSQSPDVLATKVGAGHWSLSAEK